MSAAPAYYPSWSELQPEILDLFMHRLPSLADRVRLRAVCHPWRSNTRMQSLPPPFPWLTLPDGTFLSIPGGEIHRIRVPDGACCFGSIDEWLFLMHNNGGFSLMNPFSMATLVLELPKLPTVLRCCADGCTAVNLRDYDYKLVVSSRLESSPHSLIAALIGGIGCDPKVSVWQPPIASDFAAWFTAREEILNLSDMEVIPNLSDIAFLSGKLYGVTFGGLLVLEITKSTGGRPNISSVRCVIDFSDDLLHTHPQLLPSLHRFKQHLVECGDRLLLLIQWISRAGGTSSNVVGHDLRTTAFGVFEADLSTNPGKWRRDSSLGGLVLFISNHFSKSLPAGECNGTQDDCIYFMCDYPCRYSAEHPLCDSGVYNMRNGTITPLLSETAVVRAHGAGQWCPTWLFPSIAM
ncbi:unnamed protein product [Urochloa humidicola]